MRAEYFKLQESAEKLRRLYLTPATDISSAGSTGQPAFINFTDIRLLKMTTLPSSWKVFWSTVDCTVGQINELRKVLKREVCPFFKHLEIWIESCF